MSLSRSTLRSLSLTLLAAASVAAAQQPSQPTVIPTGNWPVSIAAAANVRNGVGLGLIYCDPAVADTSAGCHLLRGSPTTGFTPTETFTGTTGYTGIYTATFLTFNSGTAQPATLSTRSTEPHRLDIFIQLGQGSKGGPTFHTLGALPAAPGQLQYAVFDLNRSADFSNGGFLAEDINNAYIYSIDQGAILRASIALDGGPGPFITGDFNADGKTDIIALGTTSHGLTTYFGDGTGNYSAGTKYALPGGIYSMLVQDIDGDGIPDLLVEGANGALSYFPGTASGFATTPIPLSGAQDGRTGNGGHIIAVADLNHDGFPDILTSTPAGISVLLGTGGLNYKLAGIYNAGPGRSSYALADFDGDGNLDLAVDSPEGIAILYGNPDGSFQTSLSFAAGQPAYSLALGRFTSSTIPVTGNVDAIVATGVPQFQVMSGDGLGNFTARLPPTPAGSPQTNSTRTLWSTVIQSYLDSDNILDVAVTQNGKPPYSGNAITFHFGNGDGTFSAPVIADPTGSPHFGSTDINEFNADGAIDLINFDTTYCAGYAVNARTGVAPGTILYGNPTATPYNLVASGYIKGNPTRADVACELNGIIYLLRNISGGSASNGPRFVLSATLPAPPSIAVTDASGALPSTGLLASDLLFFDLDGDGNGDIVALYHNLAADPAHPSALTPNQIYIYWGNGDGTFSAPTILTPARNFYQANIADLNGDTRPDLILSDGYILGVIPSQGRARTFGPEQHYLAGMGINGIRTFPVNAHNTLIVANGGAVLTNPAVNRGTLASNAEVNTGGITVLLPLSPAATTLTGTVSVTPHNPGYGRAITLTATFATPISSPISTSAVYFFIDNTPIPFGTGIMANTATFTISSPTYAVGVHTITATYPGDANNATLTVTGSFTVTLLPSQTTLTNVVSPIHYGEIIGDIAKGYASALDPTDSTPVDGGNLNFLIDNNIVCTLPVISGLTQTCPSSTGAGYSVGTYTLSAAYLGNQFYLPSTSIGYTVQVLPDDITGALSSSANPALFGAPITFTANFTSAFATPTGTVTFFDGNTPLGSVLLNSAGTAMFTSSALVFGTHPITATLAASLNFNGATTPILQQVVLAPLVPTTTQLTSSLNPSTIGQSVTFTALVRTATSPAIPVAIGSVIFTADTLTLGSVLLDATGSASISISTLGVGSHIVVATYPGILAPGSGFLGSATTLVQQVNPPPGFTLTVNPTDLSVPIGNYAATLVTITSINGFNAPVALACANLPRAVTCTFDTVTIPNASGSTHLHIFATAPHDCDNTAPYFITPAGPITGLGLLGAATLLLLIRRRRKLIQAITLTLALTLLPTLTGCGRCTDLGVFPGPYTFTVTATSGTSTTSTTVHMTAHL